MKICDVCHKERDDSQFYGTDTTCQFCIDEIGSSYELSKEDQI